MLLDEHRGFFQRIHDKKTLDLLSKTGRFYVKRTRSWLINDFVFFLGKAWRRKGLHFLGYGRIYGVYADYETTFEEEIYCQMNGYKWIIQLDRLALFKDPIHINELDMEEIKATYTRRKPILDEGAMDAIFEFVEENFLWNNLESQTSTDSRKLHNLS